MSRLWNARNEDESELTRSEHTHTSSLPQGAILYSTVFPSPALCYVLLHLSLVLIPFYFPSFVGFPIAALWYFFLPNSLIFFLCQTSLPYSKDLMPSLYLEVLAHSPLPPISLVLSNYRVRILFGYTPSYLPEWTSPPFLSAILLFQAPWNSNLSPNPFAFP